MKKSASRRRPSRSPAARRSSRPAGTIREPAGLANRVGLLRARLKKAGVPALLLTNPRDIRYLTGFAGDDSWALVPARAGRVWVISDFRFDEQIQREAPHVGVVMRDGPIAGALASLVTRLKLASFAVQEQYITLAQRKALASGVGSEALIEFDDQLLQQRSVKDASEVTAIRKALRIQQEAFRRTIAQIEPGQSEVEIAAFLEYQMRQLGADGPSFPTIVAADANASLPHAVPGRKKVRQGGLVLIDWGARFGGYCSDLTRVVGVGGMNPRMREVYRIVLEAQQAAIAAIGPGKRLADIDAAARDVITQAGFGRQFGHSTGHGLGLDIHELPTLSGRSEGELEPGHVVTVEPGIYLPGVGGVRIEDDVLVTARGHQKLSDLPTDLESAII